MISKVKKWVKKIFIPKNEFKETPVKKIEKPRSVYLGIPAPLFPPFDSWFGHAPKSEKTQEILKKEEESKKCPTCKCGKEVDNIHEVMYNMSTASGSTTVQLDPIGGSENVWQSGAGPHF